MKVALAALAAIGASLITPAPAKAAYFPGQAIEAPSLVETVQACRTRTVRTVRNGRVTVRRVRDCGPRRGGTIVVPGFRPGVVIGRPSCRNVTTRVRQGNRTVVRTVRRC